MGSRSVGMDFSAAIEGMRGSSRRVSPTKGSRDFPFGVYQRCRGALIGRHAASAFAGDEFRFERKDSDVVAQSATVSPSSRRIGPRYCAGSCHPLQTSIHPLKFEQQRSSSSQVSSMALAALPAAGNTVLNRRSDSSR